MEPVSTVTTALTIAKAAGEISKKLCDFQKSLKDREAKQHVDEILDKVRELKQSASELEDENRALREKLRFKSDEYEFRNPFYYHKSNPNRAYVPRVFQSKSKLQWENRALTVGSIAVGVSSVGISSTLRKNDSNRHPGSAQKDGARLQSATKNLANSFLIGSCLVDNRVRNMNP